jgi:DNA-binding beta-propeller fold protein YncE
MPTQLPGSPFFIKQTWVIGGVGNWDYLTLDAAAGRLFIAHGPVVQVVDVETGQLAGAVSGLHEAHSVALDDTGEFGYVSDGPANQVKVFDRRTLAVVGTISTGPVPRALVFEPRNRLLFAVCTMPVTPSQPATAQGRAPNAARPAPGNVPPRPPANEEIKSSVTVIDAQTRQPLGEILMPGRLGFAETDGNGEIFINMVSRNQIVRLDAQSIAALLGRRADQAAAQTTIAQPPATQPTATQQAAAQPGQVTSAQATASATSQVLDWSHESRLPNSAENRMNLLSVGPECRELSALAVDGAHQRLFAACANMRLLVLNGGTGEQVASLPIGPGPEAIGYDAGRGLLYSANGGAQGSLTIIRQDVTDSYAVVQNLPTRQRARTLAVNPATGQVYLVTDMLGVRLDRPGTIGTLQTAPVRGSFQVLVIGN